MQFEVAPRRNQLLAQSLQLGIESLEFLVLHLPNILELHLKLVFFLSQQLCPAFKDLDLLGVIRVLVVKLELKPFEVQVFAHLFESLLFVL